jgi:hypothetical protein
MIWASEHGQRVWFFVLQVQWHHLISTGSCCVLMSDTKYVLLVDGGDNMEMKLLGLGLRSGLNT